jgi:hypothetical protein
MTRQPLQTPATRWPGAMRVAILATIGQGRWWLLALAAFLVRGGLLLVVIPLLILPSPADVASLVLPSVAGTGLAHPTGALVAILAVTGLITFGLVVVTTVLGTWLEAALVDATAADEEVEALAPTERLGRVPLEAALEVRLAAHLPTAVALGFGVFAFADALTSELVSPRPGSPLLVQVLQRAPLAAGLIAAAWLAGEAWGGLALRRLATTTSTRAALRAGLGDLVRPSGLATLVLTTVVVALPLVALWLAAGRAFDRLWPLLVEPADDGIVLLALGLLVGTWFAGLWLLGIALAWRSAAWTAEVVRHG